MNKQELRKIVREIISESFNDIKEASGSHSDSKEMDKALRWAKNNLEGIRIENTKSGYKICPPKSMSNDCYSVHKGGKGIYDLYRFLASVYNVSKHEIENAVSSNRSLNILALKLPVIKLGKKEWILDKDNEQLILKRNVKTKKSISDLEDEEFEKVFQYF